MKGNRGGRDYLGAKTKSSNSSDISRYTYKPKYESSHESDLYNTSEIDRVRTDISFSQGLSRIRINSDFEPSSSQNKM